jgi:hypothetical protein
VLSVARLVEPEDVRETGDEAKSQGGTPFILDINGNDKATPIYAAIPFPFKVSGVPLS